MICVHPRLKNTPAGIAPAGFRPRAGARRDTAVKNQTNSAADKRRYTQISKIQDDAFYFSAWLPEIHQERDFQPRRFQVIKALCGMDFVQCSRCLQLHNHTVFNQEISKEISDRMVAIDTLIGCCCWIFSPFCCSSIARAFS